MTRLLVSVRSVDEARLAARGGADFIDLKEPRAGALGGLPPAVIADVLAALRADGCTLPVSATIGDLGPHELPTILARVHAVGACDVTYVKVGLERGPQAPSVLDALAVSGQAVVPVLIADRGLDDTLVDHALRLRFPALMVDTADKAAGSLFEVLPLAVIEGFVARVRARGVLAGIAGALQQDHLPALRALAPDFAGFRSAVCAGERGGDLAAGRLQALVQAMQPVAAAA